MLGTAPCICGCEHYKLKHRFDTWRVGKREARAVSIAKCSKCGLLRTLPPPRTEYNSDYAEAYAERSALGSRQHLSHLGDLFAIAYRQVLHDNFPVGARLLDYGSASGLFLGLAEALGFEVTGFDINPSAAAASRRRGFKMAQGDPCDSTAGSINYHVIHCSHVIEHLRNPAWTLERFFSIAQPGGFLLLACPNVLSLNRFVQRWNWAWDPDCHFWHFRTSQVLALVRRAGWKVVRVRSEDGSVPNSRWKKRIADGFARFGFGDSMLVTAQKPPTNFTTEGREQT